jgi:phosphoribosylaminoimidazolecarboxamide formyltransferase / IMP cyclohydrolase
VKQIKSALISVFNKDGLDAIISELTKLDVTIYSTGGTAKYIEEHGGTITPVESLTSYPSILGGRVKTLHPAVFGGILNRGENPSDQAEMATHNIPNIDLIIVDLYPFEDTVASTDDESEIIEKIDIGGVSLIRAGAKNYSDKLIVAHKDLYPGLVDLLSSNGGAIDENARKEYAKKAFAVTAQYDKAISDYFTGVEHRQLRYGENPHQKARFEGNLDSILNQIHGKAISYNNLLDIDAAVNLQQDFSRHEGAMFAVLKHNNACGFAIRDTVETAYTDALAGDPISAFGGVLITNKNINLAVAEEMHKLFFEVLIAPSFDADALVVLKQKKNRILLISTLEQLPGIQYRSILNGTLVQEKDIVVDSRENAKVVSDSSPTEQQMSDLLFANILVKNTKSNGIVLVKNGQLLASGTGQTSRIDALNQAIQKAGVFQFDLAGCVMASDAFFPFPDCVEIADSAGVVAVIHPGGSIKDQLSIDYCNAHGMSMVMTGHRHFKH